MRPEVVDDQHARVVERPGGARLLLEAAQAVGVGREAGGQDLDGDVAPEAGAAGAVDLTHVPGPEGREDLVRADAAARGQHRSLPQASAF